MGEKKQPQSEKSPLVRRPPVVAVLGHVDHGKTSLLDQIRRTNFQSQEDGGITQTIGAYQVQVDGREITFIDTPGHAAFTSLRARGGQSADLVVLVVAANDGVQPQTVEAIHHAQAAGAGIIVALNKIDLPSAVPAKVMSELLKYNLQVKPQGGEVPLVETSATQGVGIHKLLKTILQEAEKLDLLANPHAHPSGIVLETMLDEKRGPVATVIVQEGTLRLREIIATERAYAKVRALSDWQGKRLDQVGPGQPAVVLGFKSLPVAGTHFKWLATEKEAQAQVERAQLQRQTGKQLSPLERIKAGLPKLESSQVPLVLKVDAQGSLEALQESLVGLSTDEVKVRILHQGIGPINEADILLAAAAKSAIVGKGIVLGFRVGIEKSAAQVAQYERVVYRTYEIIYRLIEELQELIAGEVEALTPNVLGEAKVKQVFKLSDGTLIAGSEVLTGKIKRGHRARLVRGEELIGEARVISLRRGKDEISTAEARTECGIGTKPALNFKVGDVLETLAE